MSAAAGAAGFLYHTGRLCDGAKQLMIADRRGELERWYMRQGLDLDRACSLAAKTLASEKAAA